ncbi:hypothetical protein, partial [Arthrobacter sp. CAL618]|uniref:hypothetical protein n=1 Tax=Arthrobacter sp. CAL618 TaxID=1055770 RepID=UPI0005574666
MDRIENLIRGLDPVRAEGRANGAADSQPASEADEDAGVFSDDRPVVVPLARRRTVVLVLAGAAAAAAVAGAIVVGSSMGVLGPLPAGTTDP